MVAAEGENVGMFQFSKEWEENVLKQFRLLVRGLTLPVVAVGRVPEVVADLVSSHPLH